MTLLSSRTKMKLKRFGKRVLTILGVGIAVYYLYAPVWRAAEWVAWNWIRVEFIATCRVFEFRLDDDVNDFEFVYGPYTDEYLKVVEAKWQETNPDIPLTVTEDGRLKVPLGFYIPVDLYALNVVGNAEKEERGWSVSARSSYEIYQRRLAEGADMTPFQHFAERIDLSYWDYSDPELREKAERRLVAPVCGFMDELIRKDGALAPTSGQ